VIVLQLRLAKLTYNLSSINTPFQSELLTGSLNVLHQEAATFERTVPTNAMKMKNARFETTDGRKPVGSRRNAAAG
jgi:hypothetical protein